MNENESVKLNESEQTDSSKGIGKLIHLMESAQIDSFKGTNTNQSLKLIKLYLWVYLIVVSVCSAVKLHMQTTLY